MAPESPVSRRRFAVDPALTGLDSATVQSEQRLAALIAARRKAAAVGAAGRRGDTLLAHLTPTAAALLRAAGGAGTVNPHTGLPEFYQVGGPLDGVSVDALRAVLRLPPGGSDTTGTPGGPFGATDPVTAGATGLDLPVAPTAVTTVGQGQDGAHSGSGQASAQTVPANGQTIQPMSHLGTQLAASGLKCDGFTAGCQNGGSWGTSAIYGIRGRNLCRACAVKMYGIEDEPAKEQTRILERYLLGE